MLRDKLQATTEAEAVKKECELEKQQLADEWEHVKARERSLKLEFERLEDRTKTRADLLVKNEIDALRGKYEAKKSMYNGLLVGALLYGLLVTVFEAIRSDVFMSHFKAFFLGVWEILAGWFKLAFMLADTLSQLGDKIPQPIVAFIVHWLLYVLGAGVVIGTVGFGVGWVLLRVIDFYQEKMADEFSLAFTLVSVAVLVFFADLLAKLPFNLLVLWLLTHVLYVGIRWYVQGCRENRGYY